jgi:hypothetical protein
MFQRSILCTHPQGFVRNDGEMKEIEGKQEIEKSQKVEKLCTCLSGPFTEIARYARYARNNQALRDNFWLTPPSVFCMTVQFLD